MPCRTKACVFPPMDNGYCLNCQWQVPESDSDRIARMSQPISSDRVAAGPLVAAVRKQATQPKAPPVGEKWRWLKDGFAALKEGEEMEIPVPPGESVVRFQTSCHGNLNGSKASRFNKFTFRRNKAGTALILTKLGKWETRIAMGEGPVAPGPPAEQVSQPPAVLVPSSPAPPTPPLRAEAMAELQERNPATYQVALRQARTDLEEWLQKKEELESKIVRLRQVIDGLTALCGQGP